MSDLGRGQVSVFKGYSDRSEERELAMAPNNMPIRAYMFSYSGLGERGPNELRYYIDPMKSRVEKLSRFVERQFVTIRENEVTVFYSILANCVRIVRYWCFSALR